MTQDEVTVGRAGGKRRQRRVTCAGFGPRVTVCPNASAPTPCTSAPATEPPHPSPRPKDNVNNPGLGEALEIVSLNHLDKVEAPAASLVLCDNSNYSLLFEATLKCFPSLALQEYFVARGWGERAGGGEGPLYRRVCQRLSYVLFKRYSGRANGAEPRGWVVGRDAREKRDDPGQFLAVTLIKSFISALATSTLPVPDPYDRPMDGVGFPRHDLKITRKSAFIVYEWPDKFIWNAENAPNGPS